MSNLHPTLINPVKLIKAQKARIWELGKVVRGCYVDDTEVLKLQYTMVVVGDDEVEVEMRWEDVPVVAVSIMRLGHHAPTANPIHHLPSSSSSASTSFQ